MSTILTSHHNPCKKFCLKTEKKLAKQCQENRFSTIGQFRCQSQYEMTISTTDRSELCSRLILLVSKTRSFKFMHLINYHGVSPNKSEERPAALAQ